PLILSDARRFSLYLGTQHPHSFPTRRSSDLHLNKTNRDQILKLLQGFKPELIHGFPSALSQLARLFPDGLPYEIPGRTEITAPADRKSTRLNSSHVSISYAVFCLKKKTLQRR